MPYLVIVYCFLNITCVCVVRVRVRVCVCVCVCACACVCVIFSVYFCSIFVQECSVKLQIRAQPRA